MILLDTHVLVWWVSEEKKLSKQARTAIQDAVKRDGVAVSAISIWELSMLLKNGRLEVTMDKKIWLDRVLEAPKLHVIPVDAIIARESVNLPGSFHADPADRMIVATARILGLSLVTLDKKIRRYTNVKTVW